MTKLIEILLGSLSGVLAIIVGLISSFARRWKNKTEERDKEIKEMKHERKVLAQDYNHAMGTVEKTYNDLVSKKANGEYSIKLEPDIREGMLKSFEYDITRYHKHDID